jgi:hypothetical protein
VAIAIPSSSLRSRECSRSGAKALTGSGIKCWSMGELRIVDRPSLPSATFVLRR